jgi:methylated-DNA-[protein]-cysteine S-methyltransferase
MKRVIVRETPVGPLTIAARGGRICTLEFGEKPVFEKPVLEEPDPWHLEDESVLNRALRELEAYFSGRLRQFTVPVTLEGPPFHKKVWLHLTTIPFGRFDTYGQVAERLGSPGAARAVGNACAANPVAVIVPCHRVLATGGLGGFGGGLKAKEWLLRHEGCRLPAALSNNPSRRS